MTETGLSLGTPHYMSPEQATGDLSVGAATDIYALGCVLYEMLVGEPPFTASTPQAVLGKIIAGEPQSASRERKSVPPNVDAAIRRSLEKVSADRFQDLQDLVRALGDPTFGHDVKMGATSTASSERASVSSTVAVLVSSAALVAGVVIGSQLGRPPAAEVVRFTLSPDDMPVLSFTRNQAAASIVLSPDGASLVYVGPAGTDRQLYSRQLAELTWSPISGTDGASSPFFHPDGDLLGFFVDGVIKAVAPGGGTAIAITDSAYAAGAAWGRDGLIYFTHGRTRGLARVPETGGNEAIEFLTEPDSSQGEVRHLWPNVLPDGEGILFSIRKASLYTSDVASLSLRDRQVSTLTGGTLARYVPTGHLLHVTATGTMTIAPFDPSTSELGAPVALVEGLRMTQYTSPHVALSANGTLAYLTGAGFGIQRLVWVDRDGTETSSDLFEPSDFEDVAISPDGNRVAITVEGEEDRLGTTRRVDVYVVDRQSGRTYQLTSEGTNERPFWTTDGEQVTFSSMRDGKWSFFTRVWDASAPVQLLFTPEGRAWSGDWTRDEGLVYSEVDATGDFDILLVQPSGAASPTPIPLLNSENSEGSPAVSPNGDFLAFTSNESGRDEVYVMPLRDPRNTRRVSSDGGQAPRWSREGDELFFRFGRSGAFAARIQTTPELAVLNIEHLFAEGLHRYEADANHPAYDVDSAENRFLMLSLTDPSEEETVVVLNFFEELKRLLPN